VVRRCGVGPGHAAVLLVRPRADEAVRRCPQLRWGAQEGTRLAPGDVIDERHGCPHRRINVCTWGQVSCHPCRAKSEWKKWKVKPGGCVGTGVLTTPSYGERERWPYRSSFTSVIHQFDDVDAPSSSSAPENPDHRPMWLIHPSPS
jgi:hypothetical protein